MLSLVSEADIKTEYKSFGNKKRQGQKNNKLLWYIIKVVLQNIVSCSLEGEICYIAAPLAQNLENEELPRYHNF